MIWAAISHHYFAARNEAGVYDFNSTVRGDADRSYLLARCGYSEAVLRCAYGI